MPKPMPIVINRITFREGGATSPTIELYQLNSGWCRLWWYCFDQDGRHSETIARFKCADWEAAIKKGWQLYQDFMQ